MPAAYPCAVLVPAARGVPGLEAAVAELARRGFAVLRADADGPPAWARDALAAAALNAGHPAALFVDPDVAFDPDDAERLVARGLPVVGAVCPVAGRRALGCDPLPGTAAVRFGPHGGLLPVRGLDLGFAVVRRAVFAAVRAAAPPGERPKFFAPAPGGDAAADPGGDRRFCDRVRAAGIAVVADTTVRVWRVGPYRYGWEDAGRDPARFEDYTFHLEQRPGPAAPARAAGRPRVRRDVPREPGQPGRHPGELPGERLGRRPGRDRPAGGLADRRPVRPGQLQAGAGGRPRRRRRLRADLGGRRPRRPPPPTQPPDPAPDRPRPVRLPEPVHARPRRRPVGPGRAAPRVPPGRPPIAGPDRLWEKHRLWGVQAVVYSRRLLAAVAARWDRLPGVQDTRLLAVCDELSVPLYYSAPCWADHAPVRSGYGTPLAYAADFDPGFRLAVGPGFQPPEAVPGWLTRAEGELLWRAAAGRAVLELGAGAGRVTVCLAQSAARIDAVDAADEAEAREWVRRFGVADRVTFRAAPGPEGRYGLVVTGARDATGLAWELAMAAERLAPVGVVACRHYPDPAWPAVRRIMDEYARRHGWRRTGQTDYLGLFQT